MTPKEKAKELVLKFYQQAPLEEIKFYNNDVMAKQCALIAVDEAIITCQEIQKMYHIHKIINSDIDYQPEEYWQEVKKEIENI